MTVASTLSGSFSEALSASPPPMHHPMMATLAPCAFFFSHSRPAASTWSPHFSSFACISCAACFGSVDLSLVEIDGQGQIPLGSELVRLVLHPVVEPPVLVDHEE